MAVHPLFVASAIAASGAAICGCAAHPTSSATQTDRSILASSIPPSGSSVRSPVDELKLHFNPPARLDELSVNGPEGLMPIKVTAVGEVPDYSVPLAGLGPGQYVVTWRAMSGGREYRGSFNFSVK